MPNAQVFVISSTHFAGIDRVYAPKKKKKEKSVVFFNNRDIVSFIESCCGKGTAIENEAIREAMKKPEKQLLVN